MREKISKICLIVYLVLLVLSGFLLCTAGGRVEWFLITGLFAIPPILAGPRRYRILGSIGLVAVLGMAAVDYYAGQRFRARIERVRMGALPDVAGQSLEAVVAEFGSPDATTEYTIGEAPTKGWNHGLLFTTYPKDDPDNEGVRIRELSWQEDDSTIRACFHNPGGKWVALGAKRIPKDARF